MPGGSGNQLDIDMLLMRLNKSFGDDLRIFFAYIQPVLVAICFIFSFFTLASFHLQKENKEQIGLRRLMSAIVFLDMVSVLIRTPLVAMLSSSVEVFSDYMEYKWCEDFIRFSSDVPLAIHNMTTFLKYGLVVHGMILVFAPSKETIMLTSNKTVLFCIAVSITGAVMVIPHVFSSDFIKVEWVSKHDLFVRRTCCVVIPRESVLNIEFFQRNVFLADTVVTGGTPIILFATCGLAIIIKILRMRRSVTSSNSSVSDEFQQKPVAMAIACSLIAFALLNIPLCVNFIIITMTYGLVDLGMPIQELQYLVSYINVATTITDVMKAPVILAVFICFDPKFKGALLCFIRCKPQPKKRTTEDEELEQSPSVYNEGEEQPTIENDANTVKETIGEKQKKNDQNDVGTDSTEAIQ